MTNCLPILFFLAGHNVSGAVPPVQWHLMDWERAARTVKKLQGRIVKAVKAGKWKKVRDLQRLLTNSHSAKVLAIRRVTGNTGGKTSGIDGQLWKTPDAKFKAIGYLRGKGYKAQAVRRIKIPKSNGKWRPLGIPTMKDRAMQALHLLALDPVSETLADYSSYGFRPYRSCADAIAGCFLLLSRKNAAQWVLEGDIKGCFGHISHEWLLANIPMDKRILRQWPEAGYLEKQQPCPSKEGTPQGSVISPTLANMVLDGMVQAIDRACHIKRQDRRTNRSQVHLIRYADDFIVTSSDRAILENKAEPAIRAFPEERGLGLSEEKTHPAHINNGFDFLGQNIRKYQGTLLIKPGKKSIQTFLDKVRQTIRSYRTAKTIHLIYKPDPIIRGWALYHRHVVSSRAFSHVDYKIHWMVWYWAKRRHPHKSVAWITGRYFIRHKGYQYTLHAYDHGVAIPLIRAKAIPIRRHVKIRGHANPYDPEDEMYFEKRSDELMPDKLYGRRTLTIIFKRQQGRCVHCQQKITRQTGWHAHHLHPKHLGGSYTLENLVLLHPNCHYQVHSQHIRLPLPCLSNKH